MPYEQPLETVRRVVDNRLRAMRFWIETGGKGSRKNVSYLEQNLKRWLDDFWDLQQFKDPSIYRIVECVRQMSTADRPLFADLYAVIEVSVPADVGKARWWHRHIDDDIDFRPGEVGSYEMSVARGTVRGDPRM
jgi:hypothetical protein